MDKMTDDDGKKYNDKEDNHIKNWRGSGGQQINLVGFWLGEGGRGGKH